MASGVCKNGTLVGAARGDLAVGALDGKFGIEVANGETGALDIVVYSAGKSKRLRAPGIDIAGAAAVGTQLVAVAGRTRPGGGKLPSLVVLRVGRDGKRVGSMQVLDTALLGAPAIAFDGDTLYAVWARRAKEGDPYELAYSKWNASAVAPDPMKKLPTSSSSFAPALAFEGGKALFAWMEGDAKRGVVKAGAAASVERAFECAVPLSNEGVNARDPEVALDDHTAFVVWQELPGTREELRATTLECAL